ncbi:ABC transporter permease [uncultured Imperialibacter sp.]|uniref:ABC transporter permease n=1 Tax=uncultured Imperialibacter sp. TaxID=1672639 RepID=UPI0030DCB6F6
MKKRTHIPPPLAERLLHRVLRSDLAEEVLGDLEEKFYVTMERKSAWRAKLNYWYQVVNYLRPFAIRKSKSKNSNNYSMVTHNLKISWRSLLRNKSLSFINVFGLSVGLTTCMLIMLYVADEMSYDKHFKDGDRIVRIASDVNGEKWVAQAAPMAAALAEDFPEVEQVTRLLRFPGLERMLLRDKQTQKQFFESNGYYVDSTYFEVLSTELLFGDSKTALSEPNSIVISQDVANRFFGSENPVGKVLEVGLSFGVFNYTVKGVLKKNPYKSHIPANLLLSMNNGDVGGWVDRQKSWATNSIFHTYVKLKEGTDPLVFEGKLDEFFDRHGAAYFEASGIKKTLFVQPVTDIYLHSTYEFEVAANGNIKYLYIFTSIAGFLLLIACINFMNLSTARSERRAKEVGMKKVIGASKSSLISQFFIESILMSVLALFFSLILIQLALPAFSELTDKQLSLLQLPNLLAWLAVLTLLTGLLAGVYPAFFLSSLRPAAVLKGKLKNSSTASAIRQGLVIFQFSVSIILILGSLVINQQMNYLSHQNLGFDKARKIVLPLLTSEAGSNAVAFKNALLGNSQVVSAAIGGSYPGIESLTDMLFYAEGKEKTDNVDIQTTYVQEGYLKTLGITLLEGRTFSKEFQADSNALVLNEEAVSQLGYPLEDAVGRSIHYEIDGQKYAMRIIGVVKDYHHQSLHQKIKPLALTVAPLFSGPTAYVIVDTSGGDYSKLTASFEETWKEFNPNSPFSYSFLDADFERNYQNEARTLTLIQYFTLIAIIVACMGLFGLAAFTAERRTREIGIRKVLGATVSQIVAMLSTDFMKLVGLSVLIASPIAYLAMQKWLNGFAYHIDISWWLFAVAAGIAAILALVTVSFQAIKAATSNPVKSLKAE